MNMLFVLKPAAVAATVLLLSADALAGDAKSACVTAAKAKFGKS